MNTDEGIEFIAVALSNNKYESQEVVDKDEHGNIYTISEVNDCFSVNVCNQSGRVRYRIPINDRMSIQSKIDEMKPLFAKLNEV